MPTYNQSDYIKLAIESVLNQSYSDFELIIIDNFSKDHTALTIQQFNDARIKYFKFNNGGVIAAGRNFGVKQAKGDVLAFLDSDDVWLPEMLSSQSALLSDEVCLVSSCFQPIGNVVKCINHLAYIRSDEVRRLSYSDIIHANPIMTSSVLLYKKTFEQAGGFDESADFRFIEDWELWLRLASQQDVLINGEALLQYRISSKTDRDLRDVKLRTLLIIKKNQNLGLLSNALISRLNGNCFVDIGKAHLDMNDRAGISYYYKSLPLSKGVNNKLRALLGLFLFYIPVASRTKLINKLYSLNSTLFQGR